MPASASLISRLAADASETSSGEWIQGFAALAWLSGNLAMTILKENVHFWRNAGGYPVPLREFTLHFYYPILFVSLVICCALSWRLLRRYTVRYYCPIFSCGLVLLPWCLLFLNCGVLVANNINNMIEGRPLHYHGTEI
jgi:hypothetical protein